MTGFNSQSQITVNWENNGFAKVLSEIKQIEEAAKGLNISGATKKGADGMLTNVKSIKSEQQKLAELELARIKNENSKIKNEREKRRENNKRRRREYEDNQKKIKDKELSDAKKLEDEKTKILNDAQTKQAFLRKQNATNERKEKLARDLKAIQDDRILTKHQRNIEIAERKKAFAEYEKFVSSSRLKGAINGERIHIARHGANSIEGINATNRRIEAENALSNKNSLLEKASGNVSKAQIASDEFNKKQSNKFEDAKRLEALSRSELQIGTKRISQHEKDIQNAKAAGEYDKLMLKQKEQEIHDNRVRLKNFKEGSAEHLSIQSKITDGLTESYKIQTKINKGQLQKHEAEEAKRVHQINRDAQFYTRANVALVAPAMIGAVNSMKHLKEKEKAMIALTAAMGGDEAKILYGKLLDYSQNSPTNIQEVATSASAMQNYAETNKQDLFTVTKTIEDALAVSALDVTSKNRARYQLTEMSNKGYGTPSQDIMKLFKNAHIPFQKIYKDLFGKKWDGGNIDFGDILKILKAYNESPYAIEAWKLLKKSYSFQEERLAETSGNMSGALGGLTNEIIGVSGKFSSLSNDLYNSSKKSILPSILYLFI